MRRLVVTCSVVLLWAGTATASVPVGLQDTCACGGSKVLVGGGPTSYGWWLCFYIVNGQTLVSEYHYGGC